jgi:hypothetical protein
MGMDCRNIVVFVLIAVWHPPTPLRAGNVPGKAAVILGGARRISAIGHPLPARLVRSSLAAYGPARSPGLGDPIFRHPQAKRMVVGLDLAQAGEFKALEEPGERPALEEVDPLSPGDVVHARSVVLAGNFDNWVRRTLHAYEQEDGSHHACADLRQQLQTRGHDFRLWLEVEITANKARLADPKTAAGAEQLQAANARLEAALGRWRSHVGSILDNLGGEAQAGAEGKSDGLLAADPG